ncbi:MAG: SDR family oxidoreductase [Anaerolineae bacterium]
MMRMLITGGSGLLGGNLALMAAREHEVYATYYRHRTVLKGCQMVRLNLTDEKQIHDLVADIKPEVVVHTAAMTDADRCEGEKEQAWRVNVTGTAHLVGACARTGSRLIYVSTDLIFDGRKGLYSEEDDPNPLSYYGRTKLEGEKVLAGHGVNCCILRSALMYGWSPHPGKPSSSEWVLEGLRAGRALNLFDDQYRSPILVNNLGEAILDICQQELQGLYHLAGPERISRYHFARILAEVFDLNTELLRPGSLDKARLAAARPRDCSLRVEKARQVLNVELLDPRRGIQRLKELEDGGYVEELRQSERSKD